ncbi:DALR anticodon-binding domain-containing protein 3 isoform X1 [Oenanthe melanoleuca]|uniref:DALR anticodon-binding domain-containing protein 3 isoform X1 n=1 Tax=Oenanthe melanoleuca TaxID=2939378 RepID=UPI0024C1C58C|nr:DALR anticodon-binding domain-containing protein 3 isoform X1 [Oenanthe melanoleuca]
MGPVGFPTRFEFPPWRCRGLLAGAGGLEALAAAGPDRAVSASGRRCRGRCPPSGDGSCFRAPSGADGLAPVAPAPPGLCSEPFPFGSAVPPSPWHPARGAGGAGGTTPVSAGTPDHNGLAVAPRTSSAPVPAGAARGRVGGAVAAGPCGAAAAGLPADAGGAGGAGAARRGLPAPAGASARAGCPGGGDADGLRGAALPGAAHPHRPAAPPPPLRPGGRAPGSAAARPGVSAAVPSCSRPLATAPAAPSACLALFRRVSVRLVPALSEERSWDVLRQLRIYWPSGSGGSSLTDAISALKAALDQCPCAAESEQGAGTAEGVICKVHLKSFVEQQGLLGYDPNLDVLLVTEGTLQSLAELQEAVLQCPAKVQSSCCSIVHVVNCEEEFQQQQLDVLWRILDPGAHTALQKHLVCGPVKVTNPSSPIGADQYLQLRKRQMYEASVMKYGELAQDEAWTEVIDTLTVAAIRFELLSTAHRSQITLDLENNSISTKGTKSGAFVMYNCARLATLFSAFQRAVEQGTYPPLPPVSQLNFSCLREEGEWLLLFNYLLPFPEVLQQAAQLPPSSKGIRVTANTETVCRFLIQLSMDFSSYYNRVHILGEPFPHLFDQMFARLQLLGAVRDVFHSALATLHLPPLSQI